MATKFELSLKNIVGAFTICSALTAVAAWARPYIASDDPPLASISRVTKQDQKLLELSENLKTIQTHQEASDQTQMFLAKGFWVLQLTQAQEQLRQNPDNVSARQQMNAAQEALSGIQQRLFNKP